MELEKNYIQGLRALQLEVSGPEGSLREFSSKINFMINQEIEVRESGIDRLREAYKALQTTYIGEEFLQDGSCFLSRYIFALNPRIRELEPQKMRILQLEKEAENIILSAVEEDMTYSLQPSPRDKQKFGLSRLLYGTKKDVKDASSPDVAILTKFERFNATDAVLRETIVRYNDKKISLKKVIEQAADLATSPGTRGRFMEKGFLKQEYACIESMKGLIANWADYQGDIAQSLNVISSQYRLAAPMISVSTEIATLSEKIHTTLAGFNQIHSYKNLEFGIGTGAKLPAIIFGCPIPPTVSIGDVSSLEAL